MTPDPVIAPQKVPAVAISTQTAPSETAAPEGATGATAIPVTVDGVELTFGAHDSADGTIGLAWYQGEDACSVLAVLQGIAGAVGLGSALDDLLEVISDRLRLTLTQVLYASVQGDTGTTYVVSFSLGTGFDLSSVSPLLAQALAGDELLAVGDLQVYTTTAALTREQARLVNALVDETGVELTGLPDRDLEAGLSFGYSLSVAGEEHLFGLAVEEPASDGTEDDDSTAPTPDEDTGGEDGTDDGGSSGLTLVKEGSTYTLWYELQKAFGAAEFSRLGVRYTSEENELWFLLDASLKSGSMELSLQELGFGSELTRFSPGFSLAGVGVSYSTASLSLTGQLALMDPEDLAAGLEGAVVVQTKTFSLAALGAYGTENGHPSLFVYGVLDKPIGGPAFFFVEGLAAGLGYNRALTTPAIEDIPDFPLVSMACSPTTDAEELAAMVSDLQDSITPSVGDQFYAFGVRFSTFKIVDSFALLVALVDGDAWKLRLLGYSTLTAPLPKEGETTDPLAYLELALDGTLDPGEGSMAIQGQLTDNSFVFSRDCRVTGGFAFYAWFSGDHEGDFVQTIGGYHPSFAVPSHYPTVPRLALDWRISGSISVEGDLYFALTPRMLMAGGYLKATWKESGIEAWFKTRADFLVAWKPYSYSARLSVEVGASAKVKVDLGFTKVHKKITVSVGAELKLWGPDFSGKAKIRCSLLSFTISFGSGSRTVEAIGWDEFRTSFLPASTRVCTIQAVSGVLGTVKGSPDAWVMLARDLCLQIDTLVPISLAKHHHGDGSREWSGYGDEFGLAPMNVPSAASTLHVSIRDGNGDLVEDGVFKLTERRKGLPAGVWGTSFSPGLNDARTVDAFAGFTIEPTRTTALEEGAVEVHTDTGTIGVDLYGIEGAFEWLDAPLARAEAGVPTDVSATYTGSGGGAELVAAIFDDLDTAEMDAFDPALFRAALQIEQS